MGDPVSIGLMVASVAGAYSQVKGQMQAGKAMKREGNRMAEDQRRAANNIALASEREAATAASRRSRDRYRSQLGAGGGHMDTLLTSPLGRPGSAGGLKTLLGE